MTEQQKIEAIEKHFGGRAIEDIQKTYGGFTIEMLFEIVQTTQSDNERRKQEAGLIEQRQTELESEAIQLREQAESRFKINTKSRFLESNDLATPEDFERLYPRIRDETMMTNYRNFTAKEVTRSADIYEN